MLLEEVPEGGATLPGPSGRTHHVASVRCEELSEVGFFKRINDLLLGHLEVFKLGFFGAWYACRALNAFSSYYGSGGHYDYLLDLILKFSDVSWP